MAELAALTNLGLSTYLLRKLQHKCIVTAQQFLVTDTSELIEITNLPEIEVRELKSKICALHFPRPQTALTLREQRRALSNYGSGIAALDEMLRRAPLMAGRVWEFCGRSGVGKTQLCHTIAAHFAAELHSAVLYIDTKCDFSGARFMEILRARGLDKATCGRIMHEVLVERVYTAAGVCDILQKLETCKTSTDENGSAGGVKLVIIDALPAVWLNLSEDKERLKGKYLLATLANQLYKLAKEHQIAAVLVNLLVDMDEENDSTPVAAEDASESDDSEPTCTSSPAAVVNCQSTRPALGEYWKSVPQIRIAIELPTETESVEHNLRILRVLNSCYTSEDDTCNVHITTAGVV